MPFKRVLNKIRTRGWRTALSAIDRRCGLGKLEYLLALRWFNPFATLWLNWRCFSARQAWRLPVWVYGRPRLFCLSGFMRVEGKVSSGMVKFNVMRPGSPGYQSQQSELMLWGTIVFEGFGLIGTGNHIFVDREATLRLGRDFKITDGCQVGVFRSVEMGGLSRLSDGSRLTDSSYHPLANFMRREVAPFVKPVRIGRGVWVCHSCTIGPGAVIPDFCTVGSGTRVSKDLSLIVAPGSVIAGSPLRVLATDMRKVETYDVRIQIRDWFNARPDDPYPLPTGLTPDDCSRT